MTAVARDQRGANQFIPAEKQDSKYSYKKAFGYFPGIAQVDGMPFYIEGRDGNANVKLGQAETLRRAFEAAESRGVKFGKARMDCGNNAPRTRRVKTVFLVCRHRVGDMTARNDAMKELREIFRQFMSRFLLEKTRIEQGVLYFDPRVQFTEISPYFASGCACAYFQVAVNTMTDLVYRPDEWQTT